MVLVSLIISVTTALTYTVFIYYHTLLLPLILASLILRLTLNLEYLIAILSSFILSTYWSYNLVPTLVCLLMVKISLSYTIINYLLYKDTWTLIIYWIMT